MKEAAPRRLQAGWRAIEQDDFRGAETVARNALAVNASDWPSGEMAIRGVLFAPGKTLPAGGGI